jgi:hypothetical protein
MELEFAFRHCHEIKDSQQLKDVIQEVVRGDLPHAWDVLTAILAH